MSGLSAIIGSDTRVSSLPTPLLDFSNKIKLTTQYKYRVFVVNVLFFCFFNANTKKGKMLCIIVTITQINPVSVSVSFCTGSVK